MFSRHFSRTPNTIFIGNLRYSAASNSATGLSRRHFFNCKEFMHEIVTNPVVGRGVCRHRIHCINACDGGPLCELLRHGNGLAAAVEPRYRMAEPAAQLESGARGSNRTPATTGDRATRFQQEENAWQAE